MSTPQISIQSEAGDELASLVSSTAAVIIVKRLGWRRLSDASKAHSKEAIGSVRDMGNDAAALIKSFRDLGKSDDPDEAKKNVLNKAAKNPQGNYDWGTVLMSGIVTINGEPKTPALVDDLDSDTAEACVTAILRLSKPSLFETETDVKNG